MSGKICARLSVLVLIVLGLLANPVATSAGGFCGGTYIVQWGDTLGSIAAACGTTVSDLYAANPGLGNYLYAGQSLTIPANACGNCTAPGVGGVYVVQLGDTFSAIASRNGISLGALWQANPGIANIDLLYPGQMLYLPAAAQPAAPPYSNPSFFPSQPYYPTPTPVPASVPLSVGQVSPGTPLANMELSNRSGAAVYVSLQGTARDGSSVIREYPVSGTMQETIPAGWYFYVAWVRGNEFSGQFNLPGGSSHSITFHEDQVVFQ